MQEIASAREELDELCRADDSLRHARRLPKGPESAWLKVWEEEIVPAYIFCGHRGLSDSLISLAPPSTPAIDVLVKTGPAITCLEITIAYPAHHRDWDVEGSTSPGAQEALRSEMLNTIGWVSAKTALARNPRTKSVEYADEDFAGTVEESLIDWARGMAFALKKKQRGRDYGRGSTLIAYGYGLSGDFEYPRKLATLDQVLALIDADCLQNDFDQTFVFSWHNGWCREIASSRQ